MGERRERVGGPVCLAMVLLGAALDRVTQIVENEKPNHAWLGSLLCEGPWPEESGLEESGPQGSMAWVLDGGGKESR
jgi:hypothetical protein